MKSEVREKIESTIKLFMREHTDTGSFPDGVIDELCDELSKRVELALIPFLRTNKFDFGNGETKISYDDPLENPIRRAADLDD
ncbi:MAG: hypothetical protein HQ511_11385 [Rhodospirillales bacterium]|nr:hypothetical protein [Rhodospirillales bacterium]